MTRASGAPTSPSSASRVRAELCACVCPVGELNNTVTCQEATATMGASLPPHYLPPQYTCPSAEILLLINHVEATAMEEQMRTRRTVSSLQVSLG
jgi:hypothetical protein